MELLAFEAGCWRIYFAREDFLYDLKDSTSGAAMPDPADDHHAAALGH